MFCESSLAVCHFSRFMFMREIWAVGMNTELTQLLQGLCSDGLWKYAVLWSLGSERHGILTWGDGYVNKTIKDTQVRHLYDDPIDTKNQIISSTWCNNGQYQSYAFCPIEAAILSMSSHSYSLGEEFIGKVAVTGQHCWISANELCSTIMYKYHEDWQLQFAAGIKTVLLIPVIPHGVLQLGSLDTVLESLILVTLIKDLFYKLYDPSIPHNSSATGFVYSNTSRKPTATSSMDPPDVLSHDLFDLINSSAQLLTTDHLSLPHPFTMSEFPIEDAIIGAYNTSLTACPSETLGANESDLWTNVHEEPSELAHYNTVFEPEMASLPFMDKLTNPNTKLRCRSVINMEDPESDNIYGFTLTDMSQEYQEHTHGNTIVLNDDVVTSNSSIHSKLHKGLEVISREDLEDFIWHSRLKQEESTSHSLLQANGNNTDFYSQLENDNYAEFLLDAIVDQVGNTPNRESSRSTDSLVSCATQIQMKDHALRLDERSVPEPPGSQEFSPISINEGFMSSTMTVSSPKEINKTIIEECMDHTIQDMHRGNFVEIKKRCRKIELHRSRPRDRQLIQDRMKELRELIPNTSKCSIDALLDRTITHILFLQSVSEKAEKLQNKMGNEESGDETKKQLERSPLRVEELDQPGHLLIEMLCKEYEVFLEIARVFKGLQVSILKGVLEYRSDKLWARFVIEASEGFNQMQILCPLMHLLQRR